MWRNFRRTCLVVSMLTAFSGMAYGQSFTGVISGRIEDATAAAVPGAKIAAIEKETNVMTRTVSDGQGEYSLPALRPGTYRVEAEASGFKKLVRAGIEVQVNARVRLDLALALGSITETMDVSASAPLVESDNSALGNVIENRKIVNLPLNTRNPFQLAGLSPGVVPAQNFGDAFNNSANFMINGGRGNSSEVLIDGITNSVPAANPIAVIAMFPSVDALQEFKVQTSAYSAEYGRSGGGIVNMIMRSGTNGLHGTLFEFLRNSRMDANSFFANRAGTPLGSFKRNQFGTTVGGPMVRDKAFFFVNYEGLRQRSGNNATLTVPTALERAGDFRQSFQPVSGACRPIQLFDPLTTRPAAGGGFVRDAFPDSVIPAARLDRAGAKIPTYFPLPNQPGNTCTAASNYFDSLSASLTTNQMDIKLDWAPGVTHRFTAGLSWRTLEQPTANHYRSIGDTGRINGDSIPSKGGRFDYTGTYSPTLVLNARFGVTRLERVDPPNVQPGFTLSELGFAGNFQNQMTTPAGFPYMTFNGYSALGNSTSAYIFQSGTSYSFNANLTKVHGPHTIKFGVDYRINQSFENSGFNTSGAFIFSQGFTQGPDPNLPVAGRGNAIASLLLGVGTGDMLVLPGVFTSNPYMGLYVQDDFKVSRKLTLNVGLRYDLEKGRTERFHQLSWFDFTAPSPLGPKVGLPNLVGGEQFISSSRPRQFDTDPNNFGPRIGFAYSATTKTVIRGGYGIFYLPYTGEASGTASGINGFSADTTWVSSLDGLTPVGSLANPFPNGLVSVTAPGSGLLTNVGQNIGATPRDGAIDRTARVSYAQQWNLNVQREVGRQLVVEAAYSGSKGTKLVDGPTGYQLDQLTLDQMKLGTQLQQLVPNPFYGQIASGTLAQPTVTRGQLLRPYPQFLGVVNLRPNSAGSIYHAFQARVEKRFSAGFSLLAAYTNSKLIDDSSQPVTGPTTTHQNVYDRRADRSVSAQDISQRLVVSYTYELPVGRGKHLASALPAWADAVVGGWQINGITTYAAGPPLAITNSQNNSGSFSGAQRPNMKGDANLEGGRSTQDRLAQWFNTSVFSQPPAFTFGNTPRVLSNVRTDRTRNWDFSLFKEFRYRERWRAELRGELFNLRNRPQFAAPGTAFGNSTFGVVSGQASPPRQVQVALKLYF